MFLSLVCMPRLEVQPNVGFRSELLEAHFAVVGMLPLQERINYVAQVPMEGLMFDQFIRCRKRTIANVAKILFVNCVDVHVESPFIGELNLTCLTGGARGTDNKIFPGDRFLIWLGSFL